MASFLAQPIDAIRPAACFLSASGSDESSRSGSLGPRPVTLPRLALPTARANKIMALETMVPSQRLSWPRHPAM